MLADDLAARTIGTTKPERQSEPNEVLRPWLTERPIFAAELKGRMVLIWAGIKYLRH